MEAPAYRGVWIARDQGKVVMISGPAIQGEVVEAEITRQKRDYDEAVLKGVVEPSLKRLKPPCEYFGSCGGCSFQHMPYEEQVRLKEYVLEDTLRRQLQFVPDLAPSVINDEPWHYRLRAQFKVTSEGIGFHMKGTRSTVNLERCLIMSRGVNEVMKKASPFISRYKVRELHVTGDLDLVAQIISRKNSLTPEDAEEIATGLMERGLSGVVVRRGEKKPLEFGSTRVILDLAGMKYSVSIQSFIQNNWKLNQQVIRLIRDWLQPLKGLRILDLYAGAGNFSLPLADGADITAVEDNRSAVRDGRFNIQQNCISGYEYIRSSAEKFETDEKFDVMIVDPPRPGLMYRVVKSIFSMLPGRIVYISCNPATFARDLKRLGEHYEVESVRLIDFFPQTYHIESLAFLRKRQPRDIKI